VGPYRPYAAALPVLNWEGLYVGGHLGGVDNNYDVSLTAVPNVSTLNTLNLTNFTEEPNRATSFIGGAQVGYNLQFGPFVLGVEGDFSGMRSRQTLENAGASGTSITTSTTAAGTALSGASTTTSTAAAGTALSGTSTTTSTAAAGTALSSTSTATGGAITGGTLSTRLDIKSDWSASVRARGGIALGSWLFYATGGVAFTDINLSSGFVVSTASDPVGTDARSSKSYTGYTVGVGGEYSFTDYLSIGVEYRYSDYGRESFTVADPTFNTTTSVGLTSQQVTGR
jgi:opacity protein-like surface antigen